MQKLRIILQFKLFYIFLLLITLIIVFIVIKFQNNESIYNQNQTVFSGKIIKKTKTDYGYSIILQSKEKLLVYLKTCKYDLGDTVQIIGNLKKPTNNTILNNFNYKKYLNRQQIYYLVEASEIKLIEENKNIFYILKRKTLNFLNGFQSSSYLKAFLLGDSSQLDNYESYQINGISHLLAIGSMHITLLNYFIMVFFKKLNNKDISHIISFLVITVLIILTNYPISIIRTFLYLTLSYLNKKLKLNLSCLYIFYLVFSLTLLINPLYIYQKGFLYSYYISFLLILNKDNITGNYFLKLLKISFISFLGSIPLNIYFNYEINLLSIIYNLFYVPVFNLIVFPFSLLTFIFPFLDFLYYQFMLLLDNISLFLNNYTMGIIILKKIPIYILGLYLILIVYVINNYYKRKRSRLIILVLTLVIHFNYNFLIKENYFMFLDVGQGDASLFHFNNKTILIDTGGLYYTKVSENIIIMLKSLGIKKIDYLLLTHGDYDHMGDSLNLINKFRVDKVVFNNGEYNDLELKLIKVLKQKKIPYYKNIKVLKVKNIKLYFLNNEIYDNENDNSIVSYIKINNYKLLLMGDASVEVEQDLIDKYNLENIDILKVGHHGSKTSSCEKFINYIEPKYSIISVGKNNRYGHPNKEVLAYLSNTKIYRTDIDGSILFKFKKNKLKINIYSP